MKTDTPQIVYLRNDATSAFLVNTVELHFAIDAGAKTVTAMLAMRRNPDVVPLTLVLDSDEHEGQEIQ